jgi:Domain of unknown function (DUF1707)
VSAVLVSDREREYTVGLLRGHWLSGRLTAEEFEQRVAEAWRARFASDLWKALRWLPVDSPPVPRRAPSGAGSLALAIAALCLLFVSFGLLFFLTLPMAVSAFVLGHQASRRGAGGAATAGRALGIAGALFSLMPVLFVVGVLGVAL